MADGSQAYLMPRPVPAPPRKASEGLPPIKVVWEPFAGSQELVMSCPCNQILYEGTRGPGKTDTQLMKFRRYVGMGYGSFWRGVIFDREYKNLDDLVSKSLRWFPEFGDGARFLASKSDLRWVWPTGEELLFRQVKRFSDYWKYHGQEFPFIGWNELTKYPTSNLYDDLMSCNRSSFVASEHPIWFKDDPNPHFLPEIPLTVMATTNPFGAGHTWVKHRMIDIAEPGKVVFIKRQVFNPRTQKRELIVKSFVRIFGSYKENKKLAAEYVLELENITDPNKRRAWLWGDWDIVAGGAVDDLWGQHLILPRFKVPRDWKIDRTLDWGSSHPFSVGWWATANGEEVALPNGRKFCPPAGTLIRIYEWYGTEAPGTNRGLRMSAGQIAEGILRIEKELLDKKWITTKPLAGPADNQIDDVREKDVETIKSKMAKVGVTWTRSDKSPGSRKIGLALMREMLECSKSMAGPGLFFMDNCRAAIATLPVLPRDENDMDDVDTAAEDHVYDEVRYRVLARSRVHTVGSLRS